MSNWDNIERNVNKYGDFAGRTQAEQDAYYEFFAGTELSDRVAINAKKNLEYLRPPFAAATIRSRLFQVNQ